jgi:hypothetical protein
LTLGDIGGEGIVDGVVEEREGGERSEATKEGGKRPGELEV